MNRLCHLTPSAAVALVLVSLALPPARGVTIDWVTVGNPGNANDTTGYGAVNYEYRIAKHEVTIQQYTDFLNAVAATDPYSLYNTGMATNLNVAGISRSGASGGYTYSVINNGGSSGNRPITYVSWFSAARFANWMHNGQGSGSTETGAYRISTGQITAASRTGGVNTYVLSAPSTLSVGDQVAVTGLGGTAFNVSGIVTSVAESQFTIANTNSNAVATGTGRMTGASATAASNAAFYIPTENEWYKAAYYSPVKGGVGSPGYYAYATQRDSAPGNLVGSGVNQANYSTAAGFSVTQSSTYFSSQNYLTDVGAFTNSASYYGTFDQSGSVSEWNEGITGTSLGSLGARRGAQGGSWDFYAASLSSSSRSPQSPSAYGVSLGFRLASPVPVPEPSTWAMAAGGLASAAWATFRRRKRA
ncbi:MAG: SUMF1/EgtB/PvdO family nonheme iron enzyme [Planctomycetia bacterium]